MTVKVINGKGLRDGCQKSEANDYRLVYLYGASLITIEGIPLQISKCVVCIFIGSSKGHLRPRVCMPIAHVADRTSDKFT
jgi:hypothetical protein